MMPRALSVACAVLAGLLSAAPAAGAAEVQQVRDGAVYATGTLVTGPCQVGEDFPDQGSPHQRVHTINDETHINAVRPYRILGGDSEAWPIAADSGCRPLRLKAGLYEADLFHEEIVREWCNVIIAGGREVCGPDDDPYGEWAWLALSDTNRDRHVRFRAGGKLRADAGGPYRVERGQRVRLDGSRSTPKRRIETYQWTFASAAAPAPDGGASDCPIHQDARKSGAKVSIFVLCPTIATLTVSDGTGPPARKSVQIKVAPRRLPRIRFMPPKSAGRFQGGWHYENGACLKCELGTSVNAPDPRAKVLIHRPDRPVDVRPVHDPGGPFDGAWYVTAHRFRVARQALINQDLFSGSDMYEENVGRDSRDDIDLLRRSVSAHEKWHATLIEQAMGRKDFRPERALEALIRDDEATLRRDVLTEIDVAENTLCLATMDEHVKENMREDWGDKWAMVRVPHEGSRDDWAWWDTRSLAELGHESMSCNP